MTAKRLFDILFATGGLVATAPVWILLAAVIKLEDGGPVFFSQERVGLGGRAFRVFKFRSMIPDAERLTGAVQATAHDPRVTGVGRLMRATALDELPQLLNILAGDMSVVGPRALRPDEADTTRDGSVVPLSSIPGYHERHQIRPGLTGLAQVYAARDIPRTAKFRYDRLYRRRASFCLDMILVLRSLWITAVGRWEAQRPGAGPGRRGRYNLLRRRRRAPVHAPDHARG
jgi:lipopolysaccharide/colanic/teichoic acid biosynthesis glycosyltransferase